MDAAKILSAIQKYTMAIALVVVFALFAWLTNGDMILPQNINNLIAQNGYVFVLASGMLLCILTGGNIDLSVGSVIAFAGGIGATMMEAGINWVIAVIVMLIIGGIVGAFQGFFIAYIKVPPFIATLAGMLAFRGFASAVLNGMRVQIEDATFLYVFGGGADCYIASPFPAIEIQGVGSLDTLCVIAGIAAIVLFIVMTFRNRMKAIKEGYAVDNIVGVIIKIVLISAAVLALTFALSLHKGIPTVLIWIGIVLFAYSYITTKTTIGRYLYAVGGNEKATRLSGINTKNVYFFAYVNMGFLAGLASVLTIARASAAEPSFGLCYEMDAIGACFIGGASAYGGVGNIGGVIVGALLMGVINMGMILLGGNVNYSSVVKGCVLLVAVLFDMLTKKDKK